MTGKWPENNGKIESEVGVCLGTKEREECDCGGDKTKCTFYPEKRRTEPVESESSFENTNHEIIEDPIVFDPIEDILTSKYIDPPMRELVYWFNKCGFRTLWCCYGHTEHQKCYIIFSPENNDKNFEKLFQIAYKKHKLSFGSFSKELRMNNDFTEFEPRWEWTALTKDSEIYFMKSSLEEYYKLT